MDKFNCFDCTMKTPAISCETQRPERLAQIIWHITNECHLNCAICFTRKMRQQPGALSKDCIINHVALCKQLGVRKIDISGGEPLLYPDLPFLVDLCQENNIDVTITTSGLGNAKNIEWLSNNWGRFSRIILSLDGTEYIHNTLRNSPNAYPAFLKLYKKLSESKCTIIRINTVVTQNLLLDSELKNMCEAIRHLAPKEWCLIEPYPINHTDQFQALSVTDEEYFSVVSKCRDLLALTNISVEQRTNEDFSAYWALFCDGFLYYSENKNTYDVKIKFDFDNLVNIQDFVSKNSKRHIHVAD